jgi:hypothetical protein
MFFSRLASKRLEVISKRSFILVLMCAALALFSSNVFATEEENPLAKFSKILPEKVGEFRKYGVEEINKKTKADSLRENNEFGIHYMKDFGVLYSFNRYYENKKSKQEFSIEIIQTNSEAGAYSLLTFDPTPFSFRLPSDTSFERCDIGAACFTTPFILSFVKGTTFVSISNLSMVESTSPKSSIRDAMVSLAKLIADKVDKGEEDVPPLVKHLPDWESVQIRTSYVISHNTLRYALRDKGEQNYNSVSPVIDAVPFEAGTEAIVAKYDNARLVIIEHPTPQIASDADARIQQKINELKSQGQSVPSAFKRVGNYSVFVFDAPDEATANNLINGIKYEKTVQWLYGDPYAYDRANRQYLLVAGGVIITVLKASGLALLLCFLIGGFFGGFVFMRRRKQQAMRDAFTDAGGMLRLNLDELTPQTNPSRLLEK